MDKNSDVLTFLLLGFLGLMIFTLSSNQKQLDENFSSNPRYAYPASYPAYYNSFSNDVNVFSSKCVPIKTDTDCMNRNLLQSGGDYDFSLSKCGGNKPLDLETYKYADYYQQRPDYMYMMPGVFPTQSPMVPTYEWSSRRHY